MHDWARICTHLRPVCAEIGKTLYQLAFVGSLSTEIAKMTISLEVQKTPTQIRYLQPMYLRRHSGRGH